jgi:P-type conjugative transfer protein TrbJ
MTPRLCLLALLVLGAPHLAAAQFAAVVFDPNNYAMNVLQQVNTLKSTVNEATMIANQVKALEYQVQSLLNEAKHLKTNPLQLLGRIQGLWDAYNRIMANAEGIAFGLASAQQRFETSYPALATPSMQEVAARSTQMLGSIRSASQTAIATQSIYERLCDQLDSAKQAITSAQAAQGMMQINQAQAQIQALQSEQLATLAQVEAASGRVQTEWIAKQAKEQADAQVVSERFMRDIAPQGFKPLGQ